MAEQLFPKPPRRMRQPRKDAIRWRAELGEAQAAYERARYIALRRRVVATGRALFAFLVLVLIAIAGRWAGWLPIGGA